MMISISHGNQTLWPVYIRIKNLDVKTRQSQKCPRLLLLNSIFFVYKQLEDANNKNNDLKTKINYMAL